MREQIKEEIQEHSNMVRDQMQQFAMMLANQAPIRLSSNFPPRKRLDPILPSIGMSHGGVGSAELGMDPVATRENMVGKRAEGPANSGHTNFLMPKLMLSIFDETKPRWWIRRCEKLIQYPPSG